MKKYFSCYLDLARFLAALTVVLDHFASHILSAQAARFVPGLAREAVILFFVLSGFMIAFVTETKERTIVQYAIARLARIYSVALPLLLLSYLLLYFSEKITGRAVAFDYQVSKAYIYIPFHLLFMSEFWTFSEPPVWLGSAWSLGYEFWYYVLFATLFFLKGKQRAVLATLVLALVGYKLWLLLPTWYAGVLLWRRRAILPLGKRAARIGWLLSIAVFCAYKLLAWDTALRTLGDRLWPFAGLPLGSADRYLGDYTIAIIVCVNFYCAAHAEFFALEKLQRAISGAASYTFTLYLVHVLVMAMWKFFLPGVVDSFWQAILLGLTIAVATLVIGTITEHRRRWFAAQLTRLADYFSLRQRHLSKQRDAI